MDSYMNDGLTYEHFYFIIKRSIKLVGFIYLFIIFLWHFYQIIFTQVFCFYAQVIV